MWPRSNHPPKRMGRNCGAPLLDGRPREVTWDEDTLVEEGQEPRHHRRDLCGANDRSARLSDPLGASELQPADLHRASATHSPVPLN